MPADGANECGGNRASLIWRPTLSNGAVKIPYGAPLKHFASPIAGYTVEQQGDRRAGPFVRRGHGAHAALGLVSKLPCLHTSCQDVLLPGGSVVVVNESHSEPLATTSVLGR